MTSQKEGLSQYILDVFLSKQVLFYTVCSQQAYTEGWFGKRAPHQATSVPMDCRHLHLTEVWFKLVRPHWAASVSVDSRQLHLIH